MNSVNQLMQGAGAASMGKTDTLDYKRGQLGQLCETFKRALEPVGRNLLRLQHFHEQKLEVSVL